MTRLILTFSLALSIGFYGVANAQSKLTEEQAKKGKPIYDKYCIACHGAKGKGDGAAADRLRPRPRNFKTARYKFTYVAYGKRPTDATIFRWVAEGLPGTSMPGWKDVLSEEEMWNVVAYIKTLTKKFKKDEKKKRFPEPIEIEAPPQWTDADREEGKKLFIKNCDKCHGPEGKGSGSTAVALKHDLGDRIWPRNLTKGWLYRGGNAPEDIYRTIATGITGTPMPAHLETMKPEEMWKVVGFVDGIVQRKRPKVTEVVVSRFIEGDVPRDPGDERWNVIPTGYIPLVSQIIEGERFFKSTLESVSARSFYNDKEISILVQWDDPSNSPLAKPVEMFPENGPDAMAVQLPVEIPTGMEKPYFLGGSADTPVIQWKWTSGKGAEALMGKGIMKTEIMPDASQKVEAKAVYKNGTWSAVFTRSIAAPGENDLAFEVGKYIPIGFNAWDGNNGEKNEQRAISIWYWLLLDPPPTMMVYFWPAIIGLLIAGGEVWLVFKAKRKE